VQTLELMAIMRDESGQPAGPRIVDADTARSRQKLIGQRLRDMYEDVLSEGVPSDFEALLDSLDAVLDADPAQTPARGQSGGKGE
jgi:hypothetical protein